MSYPADPLKIDMTGRILTIDPDRDPELQREKMIAGFDKEITELRATIELLQRTIGNKDHANDVLEEELRRLRSHAAL